MPSGSASSGQCLGTQSVHGHQCPGAGPSEQPAGMRTAPQHVPGGVPMMAQSQIPAGPLDSWSSLPKCNRLVLFRIRRWHHVLRADGCQLKQNGATDHSNSPWEVEHRSNSCLCLQLHTYRRSPRRQVATGRCILRCCRDGIMMTSKSSRVKCRSRAIQAWSVIFASSLTWGLPFSDQCIKGSVMILVESTCAPTAAT